MANKDMNMKEIFNEYFCDALYYGEISIEKGKITFKVDEEDKNLSLNLKEFINNSSKSGFEKAFFDLLPEKLNKETFQEGEAWGMCSWLNPVLEILDKDGFKKYKSDFFERFSSNGSRYDEKVTENFRKALYEILILEDDPKNRRDYISRVLPYSILKISDLINLGYYKDIPNETELNRYKQEDGNFSDEDLQMLTELSIIKLESLTKLKNKPSATKIRNYTQFIPASLLIGMALNGKVPYNYLEHSNLTKHDFFTLQYEALIFVLEHRDDFPDKLKITSQDILDEYGKTITGSTFYKLVMYRYVDSKQVIDVVRLNKILKLAGVPEENLFDDEDVLIFYSSNELADMFFEENMDSDFIQKYKEVLGSEELFERKSRDTIELIKSRIMYIDGKSSEEKDLMVQQYVLDAYDLGLCTSKVLNENISSKYLEEKYLAGEISERYILNLYKAGIVHKSLIREYFSEQEIFELYLQGEVDRDIITVMENTEERDNQILDAVMDGNMPLKDVVALYFGGTLTIENLEDALEFSGDKISIPLYIDETVGFPKIKEMFERKIIDYNCVTELKDNGIISSEQLEELKQTMNKTRFFDDLKGKTFTLVTSRETKEKIINPNPDEIKPKPKKKYSEKYDKEKELISKILGIDKIQGDLEEYATIESYNEKGRTTSLNGYKVFGSRNNGLVIFARFEKENAVYIMPFYQAAYFLNARGQEDSKDVVIEDFMKDKAYLRTLKQVRVVQHTEYFARNLTSVAMSLSPEYQEQFEGDDKYASDVQNLCEDMRRDYRIQKGLDEK